MSAIAVAQVTPPLAEIMRGLTAELPLNDFGLPTGIYRSDLLPFHLYDASAVKKTVDPRSDLPPLIPAVEDAQAAAVEESIDLPDMDEPDSAGEPSVDPFSLLSGQGDGLPDMITAKRVPRPEIVTSVVPSEYRIAGFPAGAIQQAFVPLQYDEGFPAFENGQAFWNRLDYEPVDAYAAFERYLYMSFGRRADPTIDEDVGEVAAGTRSIGQLITMMAPHADDVHLLTLTDKLKEYFHLFYWGLRCRSYDLFRVTQHRQQQELRAIETQDDHYIQSRSLRARLTQYMESDEEFWDMMTPKTAIDMHKHLTTLERVSAGIPGGGPQIKDEGRGGVSFEMAFATTAQAHRGDSNKGELISEEGEVLNQALQDPAAVEILQKLIIRTNGG